MKSFKSIRTKLIVSTMTIIFILFITALAVITTINVRYVNENIAKSEVSIRDSLIARGATLASNNAMAMRQMVADNAFTTIQTLVSQTVKGDKDIIYGIYMDNNRQPWVYANSANPRGIPESNMLLMDNISTWITTLSTSGHKRHREYENKEVIEFAAPVLVDREIAGWIRYGISTLAMYKTIENVRTDEQKRRNQNIMVLSIIGCLALFCGYVTVRRQTSKITKPIHNLAESSKMMAKGNYQIAIAAISNDEIGQLAEQFEHMRVTIKRYTDHLQELVDEKMQQVNDILDNIDQGLFTINLDGTVNAEYSERSNTILNVKDVASCDLSELLRMDKKKISNFMKWLNIVQDRHQKTRWEKIENLSPVKELQLSVSSKANDIRYVSISYQRIYDRRNELSKIMVLAVDETQKRLQEQQMLTERMRHENEVKMILSIANTPQDELNDFLMDTEHRLQSINVKVTDLYENVMLQRQDHPDSSNYTIDTSDINALYANIHTIKGNSGSYGFDTLAACAHKAEDWLEELRLNETRRDNTLNRLLTANHEMLNQYETIKEKIQLIFGNKDEAAIRVPQSRIDSILTLCNELNKFSHDEKVAELISKCNMLTWKPLSTITRKYQKIAQQFARRKNKHVVIEIQNEKDIYPPNILTDIDDAMIHLFRNAVDHGIELPETRQELNKGYGKIRFEFSMNETSRTLKLSDDGSGIDITKLVERSIDKNIITHEMAETFNEDQKLSLIYKPGVSTTDVVTDVSGRGVGMDVVKNKIDSIGGHIAIQSIPGQGTTFTVEVPPLSASE